MYVVAPIARPMCSLLTLYKDIFFRWTYFLVELNYCVTSHRIWRNEWNERTALSSFLVWRWSPLHFRKTRVGLHIMPIERTKVDSHLDKLLLCRAPFQRNHICSWNVLCTVQRVVCIHHFSFSSLKCIFCAQNGKSLAKPSNKKNQMKEKRFDWKWINSSQMDAHCTDSRTHTHTHRWAAVWRLKKFRKEKKNNIRGACMILIVLIICILL